MKKGKVGLKGIVGLMVLLMAGIGWGNTLTAYGDFKTSSDWMVYTETLTNAAAVSSVSLTGATVSITIQAKGGDVLWNVGGTTTEACFTIGQDQSYYDHFAMPLPPSTTLYFKPAVSGTCTVEIMQVYR